MPAPACLPCPGGFVRGRCARLPWPARLPLAVTGPGGCACPGFRRTGSAIRFIPGTEVMVMGMKESYEKKLQAQLDEWSAEIDQLKAKADKAGADAQIEYHRQVEELRSRQEEAKRKLGELREAGDGAWEDLKAGAENARDALGSALESARSRFRRGGTE